MQHTYTISSQKRKEKNQYYTIKRFPSLVCTICFPPSPPQKMSSESFIVISCWATPQSLTQWSHWAVLPIWALRIYCTIMTTSRNNMRFTLALQIPSKFKLFLKFVPPQNYHVCMDDWEQWSQHVYIHCRKVRLQTTNSGQIKAILLILMTFHCKSVSRSQLFWNNVLTNVK